MSIKGFPKRLKLLIICLLLTISAISFAAFMHLRQRHIDGAFRRDLDAFCEGTAFILHDPSIDDDLRPYKFASYVFLQDGLAESTAMQAFCNVLFCCTEGINYHIFYQFAADMGIPYYRCEALEKLLPENGPQFNVGKEFNHMPREDKNVVGSE